MYVVMYTVMWFVFGTRTRLKIKECLIISVLMYSSGGLFSVRAHDAKFFVLYNKYVTISSFILQL